MPLSRSLKILALLTVISLGYIQMHMDIIEMAYQGKKHEATIRRLKEDRQMLSFAIQNLKSAHYIGTRLLAKDSDMEFVSPEDVVQISLPVAPKNEIFEKLAASRESTGQKLLSLLSLTRPAEARTRPVDNRR